MNVPGNNFALLQLQVRAKKVKRKRRSTIFGFGDENFGVVSPSYLKPLTAEDCATPRKSILKGNCENIMNQSSAKLSKLKFSPFNGVKVIRHRNEPNFKKNLKAIGTEFTSETL